MTITLEELQKYIDENHLAVNDPLNTGMDEEEAIAEGTMVDTTDEDEGYIITPSKK